MDESIKVYCSTCFAMPYEPCVTKYLVHGDNQVTPVICPTHGSRIVDADRHNWHLSQKAPQ